MTEAHPGRLYVESERHRVATQMQRDDCAFVPYPGSGAYGDWRCERRRFHLGRHRFVNYTIGRIPRVWHVRRLWGSFRADRRLRAMKGKGGYGYRRALFPAKYEPIR